MYMFYDLISKYLFIFFSVNNNNKHNNNNNILPVFGYLLSMSKLYINYVKLKTLKKA